MSRRNAKSKIRGVLAVVTLLMILVACVFVGQLFEEKTAVSIEHAGQQMTPHTSAMNTAQVFMNDRWYAKRNVETLLIMGIDDLGGLEKNDSYNNSNQTDFFVLLMRDLDTGRTAAIHLNRDTMTDITILGVTGQPAGTRYAQLALAYNYGNGDHISSLNVVTAVEHLLYGIEVDHYITVTMDAVPIANDWAGGVTLEVLDDFTGIDETMFQGEMVRLDGRQALAYVRTRKGLDDSSNLHRMERQRQYASEWMKCAQNQLKDSQAMTELVMQLDGYYRSDCSADQLITFAESLSNNSSISVYEVEGESVQGELYMEYRVHEKALQQLVLDLFYVPVAM